MALMPVEEALRRVLDGAAPLPPEIVAVAEAYGRVLASALAARRTQPPDPMSAMDGYAVRAADLAPVPTRLRLVGEVAAGRVFSGIVGAGEAVRVFTGGVIPQGADTVVIQENTRREGDHVIIEQGEPRGGHLRPAGLDFRAGDPGLPAGRQLGVRDLALAAAMNHAVLPVHRRPRVAVLSTGDELRPPGSALAPGQIISSNSLALTAMARAAGAEAVDFGIVPDRLDQTVAAIRRVRDWGADVLVTTGGASVGDYDLVQSALAAEGMDLSFWKIAMRPGKPMMHGRLGPMRVLGLPGNPVSSYVCALLFMLPLVRRLRGLEDRSHGERQAILGRDLPENDRRQDYLRASVEERDGALIATPFPVQDSSVMSRLTQADGLVVRTPFAPPAKAGDGCTILALPF